MRSKNLYGPAAKHMVENCAKATLSTCWKLHVGLWQNPRQLSEAMVHIASTARVSTYLEVGVYAAWTCSVMAAYLGRVGAPEPFRGYAVDLNAEIMTHGTRQLLKQLNVTFVPRAQMARVLLSGSAPRTETLGASL